jgi:hypothetical protein
MKKKNRTKKQFKPDWKEIKGRPEMRKLAKDLLKMGWVLK